MNLSVLQRIFLARSFRALGDGCICILLPTYLTLLGLNLVEVGWIITATVLGSGVMSLALSFHAWRWGFRVLLVCASMAMVATGMAMTQVSEFWPLMVVGFLGTLNASMDDVSVFLPLEHALISQSTLLHTRTRAFSRYALVGSLVGALGAPAVSKGTNVTACSFYSSQVLSRRRPRCAISHPAGLIRRIVLGHRLVGSAVPPVRARRVRSPARRASPLAR